MATARTNPAISAVIDRIKEGAAVRRMRSMRQFAIDEIVLPTGPFKGERFKPDTLPWFNPWFEQVDNGLWRRFCLTGVGQGGKTLAGSALPVMYHLFETRETVVFAAPTIDTCNDKWRMDILPLIEGSAYRDQLPRSGKGSQGGSVLSIQFRHGPTLRFMSGGGGDKVRSAFTTRVAVITETDGFDEASETSRETDKFGQIEARTSAFGDRARVYLECTTSIETGRTWRELKAGTDSRLALPCPHCACWVTPEREHLVGWHDAQNVIEARENTRLVCPQCGAEWTEQERIDANRKCVLVHRGQEVTPIGQVVGAAPKTLTFAMRFTSTNNLLASIARIGEEEWSAPRNTDAGLAEKKLRQFWWTLPTEPESITLSVLDANNIAIRGIEMPRGVVPADVQKITVGVDVGKWVHHYAVVGWRAGGTPHVLDYGKLTVASAECAEEVAILAALRRYRTMAREGWASSAGTKTKPVLTLVDSGKWEPTIVSFCAESGVGFMPAKGFGEQQVSRRAMVQEPGYEVRPQPRGYNLLEINADRWKSYVHARLQTPIGQPGGLTLFKATPNEHLTFAQHLTAEKQAEEFIEGRETVTVWRAISRVNHFLDALALACVAGHGVGASAIQGIQNAPPERPPQHPHNQSVSAADYMNRGRNRY